MAEATFSSSRDESRRSLQGTGRHWIALLRAATVSVFFAIAVFAAIEGLPQWRALLPVSAFYCVISIAAAAASRVGGGDRDDTVECGDRQERAPDRKSVV